MKTINKINYGNVYWLNITKSGQKEIEYLRTNYKFHPLDLEDCLSPAQRPKLDEYENYLFLILIFPVYDERNKKVKAAEVDFFIGQNYLITIHNNNLETLKQFFQLCKNSDTARAKFIDNDPSILLYEILNRLLTQVFPLLDRLSWQVDDIEKRIFKGYEKRMVHEILVVKNNVTDIRRIMQAHKTTIRKLIARESHFFDPKRFSVYFNNLVEHTKDIWDSLDALNETINALHHTNESLISFRLNDIMKLLAIISVTMLPVTVVASIFSMNASFMPLAENPFGFWIVIGICLVVALFFLLFFKLKKWL